MPITPVFVDRPPAKISRNAIDWTEVLDALTERPGAWARVDGPLKKQTTDGRKKSLARHATAAGIALEIVDRAEAGALWVYARTVDEATPKPAPTPATAPAKKPAVAAVPNPPAPNADGDFGGGDHHCDTCGAEFRTNTRLRQHQANAHRAS